jgi:ferredoxin
VPYIEFIPMGKTAELKRGDTIAEVIERSGVAFAERCNGTGSCGNCRIRILQGINMLSKPTTEEKGVMKRFQFRKDERVACQTYARGDLKVTTSYW